MSEEIIKEEKKSPVKIIIIVLVLLVAGYFGYKKIHYIVTHETTDNAQIETQITPVLPRVAGYVKSIAVKDYDSVKTGQLVKIAKYSSKELERAL